MWASLDSGWSSCTWLSITVPNQPLPGALTIVAPLAGLELGDPKANELRRIQAVLVADMADCLSSDRRGRSERHLRDLDCMRFPLPGNLRFQAARLRADR